MPATSNPVSSYMPKLIAALNQMSDQMTGMTKRRTGTRRTAVRSIPKVKMVVGHGRPNVGNFGYGYARSEDRRRGYRR